jgi:hypothetical protein
MIEDTTNVLSKDTIGYIYILYNDMYQQYGQEIYKIGKSKNIDKRIKSYTTSYINPVEIIYRSKRCVDYTLAECLIFQKLISYRIKSNREFF